ncbi:MULTISPECIES: AAA family ATPase [unclassified Streptomyces]|uniref:AAA family ATPase n=1 Tax=unclassified Streptomyces TaxID=2593676 RepID=UPI003D8AD10F
MTGDCLFGRDAEKARLDLLVSRVPTEGSSLLLRGEAGYGKTALLDYAAARAEAQGLQVLRAGGAVSESDLPFAVLHQLLHPVVGRLDDLVPVQREALGAALGLVAADPGGNRFMISVAALTLLSDVAPVLVIIDDAQWLDRSSADVLRFVARRLAGERIGLLIAGRSGQPFDAIALPELAVGPLDDEASQALLAATAGRRLAATVRDRLLAEAAGNPLALSELHASLTEQELSGAVPLADRPFWATQLTTAFVHRAQQLPGPTRTLLLLASADSALRLDELLAAGATLGATVTDLAAAEVDGLVAVRGGSLVFRHPLVRSAVYQSARFLERQRAHLALADVLASDPDRSARHRAAAAAGNDERTAADLEAVAERAQRRGAPAEAAAVLARAVELSPAPADAARRGVRAAEMARLSGRLSWARTLADAVPALDADAPTAARLAHTLAAIRKESGDLASACRTVLGASASAVDPGTAALMLSRAAFYAWNAGDEPLLREACGRLRGLDAAPWRKAAAVLDGEEPPNPQPPSEDVPAWARLMAAYASWTAGERIWTPPAVTRVVDELRAAGSVGELQVGLEVLAEVEAERGRPENARLAADEGLRLAEEIGGELHPQIFRSLLAVQAARSGDRETATAMARAAYDWAAPRRVAGIAGRAMWAMGLSELAGGDPLAAHRHLVRIFRKGDSAAHRSIAARALADAAEAAVRAGASTELPAELLASETSLGLRARALVHPSPEAFAAALDAAGSARSPFEEARTRLAFGEWLRTAKHVREAKPLLREALEAFETLGAADWAGRARLALRSAGESAPVRDARLAGLLTPQELQVARLAAQGLSNKEIGAQLFLSHRTVGHHLYRLFPKLGIANRSELRRLDL